MEKSKSLSSIFIIFLKESLGTQGTMLFSCSRCDQTPKSNTENLTATYRLYATDFERILYDEKGQVTEVYRLSSSQQSSYTQCFGYAYGLQKRLDEFDTLLTDFPTVDYTNAEIKLVLHQEKSINIQSSDPAIRKRSIFFVQDLLRIVIRRTVSEKVKEAALNDLFNLEAYRLN